MKKGIRKILAVTFGILGTALAIYVGGYLLLFRPMRHLLVGFAAGALTRSDLIISVIKIFFFFFSAGAIWCVFDIIAGKFRDSGEDTKEK